MLKFKKKSFKEKSCVKLLVLIQKKLNYSFFFKNEGIKPTPISEKSNMFYQKNKAQTSKKMYYSLNIITIHSRYGFIPLPQKNHFTINYLKFGFIFDTESFESPYLMYIKLTKKIDKIKNHYL